MKKAIRLQKKRNGRHPTGIVRGPHLGREDIITVRDEKNARGREALMVEEADLDLVTVTVENAIFTMN